MLLFVLVACTADDAIKENLSHQDEYVTVRMHIPGLTSTATRAVLEDNITSIVALVFRNDQLKSVTKYTTANSTLNPISSISGTITIDKPTDGDVIHFLANLPANYSNDKTYISYLNEQLDKSQTDILCSLSSRDYSTLSYWGMDTYNSGDVQMDVNLYRNKAMIEIQPDAGCTFMENELFIAGLINPNNVGLLVPYSANGGFNFDLGSNDYQTLPADPDPLDKTDELTNYGAGYDNAYYVFEHANPKDENGLYVICKIGDDYYKVALQDENGNHYEIIRNHKYTILVKDLDEGCNTYAEALTSDPINLMVVEKTDVTLTLTPKANTIYYNSTSVSAVTITVGGIVSQVETLTFTAPGYTILSDYAEPESNNVFRITDKTLNEINFTLTLTDPSQATSVSVTAGGEFVNSNTPSTSFTLTENEESAGEIIMWQGAVEMHNPADGTKYAGKVLIPYSFFFDGNNQKILEGSEMRLEYNGVGYIQTYLFIDEEPSIWNITESTELTLTQGLLNSIKDSHTTVWGVDAAFMFEGGEGAVLNKVTLIPILQSIAATANKTQLYCDSDDAQVVTVNVTVPDGVETLNIGGAGNFAVAKTEGDGTLNGTTYTLGSGRTATFTFTLNSQNVTEQQTITFSDPTESVNNASVPITMAPTPTVTFTNTGSQTIRLNDTPLSVTMDVPDDKTLSEFGITITPATGLNVAQGENQLTLNNGVYSTTSGVSGTQTLTFAPTAAGTYTITFSGSGTDVNMPQESERTITLTVNAAATGGDGNIVWQWTGDTVNVSGYNTSSSIIPSSDINEQFIVNNIFGIKVEPTAGANDPCVVVKVFNRYGTGKDLSSTAHNNGNKDRINVSGSEIYEFLITQELVDLLHEQEDANNKGKIGFWGNGVIITDIYIKQGTANQ